MSCTLYLLYQNTFYFKRRLQGLAGSVDVFTGLLMVVRNGAFSLSVNATVSFALFDSYSIRDLTIYFLASIILGLFSLFTLLIVR